MPPSSLPPGAPVLECAPARTMLERQHIAILPEPLELEGQAPLFDVRVACRIYGELRPDNAVLLLHGLSRSHDALCEPEPGAWSPAGWARSLLGPGSPLERKSTCLISPNLLASPFGSMLPAEGLPSVTVADQARAIRLMLRELGVERLRAVIGFSLGGMVALQLGALFPELVGAVATVLGPAVLPTVSRQRLAEIAQGLLSDPELRPGDDEASRRALVRARVRALRSLYPRDALAEEGSLFHAERTLEREAQAFAKVFDPYCYLALCRCMGGCDLSGSLDWFEPRALVVACSSDELATPASMLDTYNALDAAGAKAGYCELQSELGHRAPYLEPKKLIPVLESFLS